MKRALKQDDVQKMQRLCTLTGFNRRKLLCLTIKHHAVSCFKALIEEVDPSNNRQLVKDLYIEAITKDVNILKVLVEKDYLDIHLPLKYSTHETGLHIAASIVMIGKEAQWLCMFQAMDYLLSLGLDPYAQNFRSDYPLTILILRLCLTGPRFLRDIETSEQQLPHVLSTSRILLEAMKSKKPEEKELPVSYRDVIILRNSFIQQLDDDNYVGLLTNTAEEISNRSLDLRVEILKLMLAAGADIRSEEARIDDEGNHHPGKTPLFFLCPSWFRRPLPSATYEEKIIKFFKLFLVYGTQPDYSSFGFLCVLLKYNQPTITAELVLPSISLMSEQQIREFRQYMTYKYDTVFPQIQELKGKSLLELCRYSLYDTVPYRRMAEHVHSLPLPKAMKEYLLLGMSFEDL